MACSVQVGYFLVRSCGEPAFGDCAKCQRQVCRSHSRPRESGEVVCVECFAGTAPAAPSTDSSSFRSSSSGSSTSSSSSEPAAPSYDAKGGAFGGGGSSSGWIPAAPLGGAGDIGPVPGGPIPGAVDLSTAADSLERQGFSPEDIAAFDQISSDENRDNPDVYDS